MNPANEPPMGNNQNPLDAKTSSTPNQTGKPEVLDADQLLRIFFTKIIKKLKKRKKSMR